MLISQVTSKFSLFKNRPSQTSWFSLIFIPLVAALMGLKKSPIAVPLIVPLIIVTILFNDYISKEHFRVSAFLPSGECLKIDRQNGPNFDLNFINDAYLQDELRTKNEIIEVTPMQTIALEQQGIFLDLQKWG